eukprot:TRINITY_DN27648_c0_g1_i1.p1 TRINITY_DN27648_c0_g1~~TRINITY_DN27648_c0_g1_i1.p1  ORF type:complete len:188 (+),score=93.11 TRINITY_DN27648_c0_g1_i1:46-609(+)
MHRVNVYDKATGIPLYDRVWKWKDQEEQKSPGTVTGLVQFFYQFAREIDKGEVNRVVFEKSIEEESRGRYGARGSYPRFGMSMNAMHRAQQRRKSVVEDNRIELYTCDNDQIVAALFVGAHFGQDKAKGLAKAIADVFVDNFDKKLVELEPKLLQAGKNPEEATFNVTFMPEFDKFSEVVDKLIEDA